MDVGRIIISTGLDIQDSFYRRAVKAVEGAEPRFIFIFQETEPPYCCSFVELPDMVRTMGSQKAENGILLWRECMNTGKWPSYPNKVVAVETPRWAVSDWEYRNERLGIEI